MNYELLKVWPSAVLLLKIYTMKTMTGIIFDIQYGAVYDGPGIRTCVYFKGCPLRCQWCHNPESQQKRPQMAYAKDRCSLCGKCVKTCPGGALKKNKTHILHNPEKCTLCGLCVPVCPAKAREIIGYSITSDAITERVSRDLPFYQNSGGGVTLSGGEATLQRDFLLKTLESLKKSGLHTTLETCGYFSEDLVAPLAELVDLFLFDLKHLDPEIHRTFTGVSNEKILFNFKEIFRRKGRSGIIPRIPLIPRFNSDEESLQQIRAFLIEGGYTGPVHLMPYNCLAKSKWEKIGRGDSYLDLRPFAEDVIERIKEIFQEEPFEVVWNG